MAYTSEMTNVQKTTVTRSNLQEMLSDIRLPRTMKFQWNHLTKRREDLLITPHNGCATREEAEAMLQKICQEHSFFVNGWYCPGGKHKGVFEEEGRWYAYRHHAQYV